MFIDKILNDVKLYKCNNEIAKRIYDELGKLPINIYHSQVLNEDVNVFILSKDLFKFLKKNKIEVTK